LIQQGRFSEALAPLQQAVQKLQGSNTFTEAYANYNLGYTLLQLGRCTEVTPYLDRSEAIQGHRKEIDQARRDVKRCLKGQD
jgi:hypothetical protein